jgi:hypothetical protein
MDCAGQRRQKVPGTEQAELVAQGGTGEGQITTEGLTRSLHVGGPASVHWPKTTAQ